MPTYEYRCPEGHDTERFFRKISDAVTEIPCPVCGKTATRHISAGAGLLFKGSGFYLTDYGKNAHRGTRPDAKASEKSETSSKGDGGGSGSKPADSGGAPAAKESKASEKPASKAPESKPSSGKKSD